MPSTITISKQINLGTRARIYLNQIVKKEIDYLPLFAPLIFAHLALCAAAIFALAAADIVRFPFRAPVVAGCSGLPSLELRPSCSLGGGDPGTSSSA